MIAEDNMGGVKELGAKLADVEQLKSIAMPICQRHRVRALRLFGSLARGEARPDSDVDLCVTFDKIPPGEYARHFFGLLHDLEDALHANIDLLTVASVKKESLRKSIQRDGICIYG